MTKKDEKKKKEPKITTRLPKSEYDENNRPILNIKIDDSLTLSQAIHKFLGEGE